MFREYCWRKALARWRTPSPSSHILSRFPRWEPSVRHKAIAQSESSRGWAVKNVFGAVHHQSGIDRVVVRRILYFDKPDAVLCRQKGAVNTMGLLLILNIFNVDWFYQGIEKYGYIATRSMIVKLLSLISMFVFVRTSDDYINYGLILCIATARQLSLQRRESEKICREQG